MNVIQRIRSKHNPFHVKKKPAGEKVQPTYSNSLLDGGGNEFDASVRTADVDVSDRSGLFESFTSGSSTCPPAKVIGDTSCLAGRQLKSCLKVQTQRDSLTRILQMKLPSYTPTIMETHDVRFDVVEFREYHRILGDNPSTTSGPPIGISWIYDPKETIVVDLDLYECDREGSRRNKRDLAIPPDVREEMLREVGYSRNEIANAVRRARKEKNQRSASIQQQKFDPILERVDTVKHGVTRMLLRRLASSDSL